MYGALKIIFIASSVLVLASSGTCSMALNRVLTQGAPKQAVSFESSGSAPTLPPAFQNRFTDADLPTLLRVHRRDAALFSERFSGKTFVSNGTFMSASDSFFNRQADCFASDEAMTRRARGWRGGQPVVVSGPIRNVVASDLQLAQGCIVTTR